MNLNIALRRESASAFTCKAKGGAVDPRTRILMEIVAGHLWMAFNLPDDTELSELEVIASELIRRVKANAGPHVIEARVRDLQRHQFCQIAPAAITSELVARVTTLVKRHSASM